MPGSVPAGEAEGALVYHCLDTGSRSSSSCGRKSACWPGRWCRGGAMAEFLLGAAGFVLAMVALGLVRVLRGPGDADRMMAAQLLGTRRHRRAAAAGRGDRRGRGASTSR